MWRPIMWCPLWCHHNGRHTAFGDIAAQVIIAHTTQDRFHCWLPGVHHRLRPIRPPSSGTYLTRSTTTARSVVCISIAGTPHWRMALASIAGIWPIVGSVTPAQMGIAHLDACVSRTNSLTTTIVARLSPPQEVMGHSRAKKRVSGRFKKAW